MPSHKVWTTFVVVLLLLVSEIACVEEDGSETEQSKKKTQIVKKFVIEIESRPSLLLQDLPEPKEQLHGKYHFRIPQVLQLDSNHSETLSLDTIQQLFVDLLGRIDKDKVFRKYSEGVETLKRNVSSESNKEEDYRDSKWREVLLTSVNGQKYHCFFPCLLQSKAQENQQKNQVNVSSLLSHLKSVCFYRLDGWWTYEFCVGKHVRQYHVDPLTMDQEMEFIMGLLPLAPNDSEPSTTDYNIEVISATKFSNGYIRTVYSNGTPCSLSGTPRSVVVDFICPANDMNSVGPSDYISSIREVGTCSYHLIFASRALCQIPQLQSKHQHERDIICELEGKDKVVDSSSIVNFGGYRRAAWF